MGSKQNMIFRRKGHIVPLNSGIIKGIVHQLDMYTLYEAVSYTDHHGVCHKLNRLRLEEKIIFLYSNIRPLG